MAKEKKDVEIEKNPEIEEEEEEPFSLDLFAKFLKDKMKTGKKKMVEVE